MTCTIISTGEELTAATRNENEPPYSLIKSKLHELIGCLYAQGYDCFYLNCEYGIPLWAAEIITSLKLVNPIRLKLVIPYEEQTVHWPEEQRDRYFRVHERADSVILASTQYHPDCISRAERFMAEQSDLLVVCGISEKRAAKYARVYERQTLFFPIS